MTSVHNPLLYTDAECLKACADSGNLLIRKAGERWASTERDYKKLVAQIAAIRETFHGTPIIECEKLRAELAAKDKT